MSPLQSGAVMSALSAMASTRMDPLITVGTAPWLGAWLCALCAANPKGAQINDANR